MPHFVVLLRGVNVGKGNRLPMADFRALLEAQGFTNVRTILNSGNAVVSSTRRSAAGHAKRVAATLQDSLGLNVNVVVKSASEFRKVVAESEFVPPADHHSKFFVAFAQRKSQIQALSTLESLVKPPDRFLLGGQAAYMYCPGGILESKAGSALLGKIGRAVTSRNWATVLKLERLLHERAA
ncbi:MAG: DUF1697 domain-containing protein [Rhodothermales bacterium]|nr:DUF1697 domain-containing protein [Rhodothermales bacterium]